MAKTMFGLKKIPLKRGSMLPKVKRMADNYLKTNTDEYGDISDPQVYQDAINMLAPYANDWAVANKIADYRNRLKGLMEKIDNAISDVTLFDWNLQKTISDMISQNYSDPRGLFYKLAETTGVALDELNLKLFGGEDVDGNEVEGLLSRIPKGQQIPNDILNYQKEMSEKVRMLMDLSNSYLTEDPETESVGPDNSDAYGVLIRTNPQSGKIVNFDITAIDSLEKPPTGYIRTNTRYGRLPIYLNTYGVGDDQEANLGGAEFKYDDTDRTLKLKGGATLGKFFARVGALFPGGPTPTGKKEEQQEFPVGSVEFDSFDIPATSIVRSGSKYYYHDANFNLWKAEDKDVLKKYLQGVGKNPDDVDSNFYLGHPDFVSQRYLPDKEGKPRVIEKSMFENVQEETSLQPSKFEEEKLGEGKGQSRFTVTPIPFPKAKELVPFTAPESPEFISGKKYDVKKTVKKGEKFFKV